MIAKILNICAWTLRLVLIAALAAGMLWLALFLRRGIGDPEKMWLVTPAMQEEADCLLLRNRGKTILIDVGSSKDADHVFSMLSEEGVEKIDCLILSTPQEEHVGNAIAIIEKYPVDLVIKPYYIQDDDNMRPLDTYMENHHIRRMIPYRNRELVYGDMQIRISPPEKFSYGKRGNHSLAITILHGDVEIFSAGDAQETRTAELLSLPVTKPEFYKANDHGKNFSGNQEFLQKLEPQIIFVTGEWGSEIENYCRETGALLVDGRMNGCRFVSDGDKIELEK